MTVAEDKQKVFYIVGTGAFDLHFELIVYILFTYQELSVRAGARQLWMGCSQSSSLWSNCFKPGVIGTTQLNNTSYCQSDQTDRLYSLSHQVPVKPSLQNRDPIL